ncbi:MAG: pyridoxal 5'-phosphate synthase glutaminase subunit PdxT [Calditrichaeota bacterium]|nr:MAG: pyridoxal 5'-phosphate synthase glutaminase subunit PdxT [Calditrichota bacterium]
MARIGVLALQGDFEKHQQAIEVLGHDAVLVKTAEALSQCDRLIIPGGESTTMLKLIDRMNLRNILADYVQRHPVFGTCAGIILLAREANALPASPFAMLDIRVERNAYGRQIDSFIDTVPWEAPEGQRELEAVFIRAPRILETGPSVRVLAQHGNDPVLVQQKHTLGATFHPELTDDRQLHRYFIEMV